MSRHVQPELLDQLPPEQPEAQASRRDLHRLNGLMGHARLISGAWRKAGADEWCSRIVDLGGGDGRLLLQLARRIGPKSRVRTALIVDRQPILSEATRAGFEEAGWTVQIEAADVFHWLSYSTVVPNTFLMANLFLHHFEGDLLPRLFRLIEKQCEGMVACEPRRSTFCLAASRLVGLIGCNEITRHDASVSVQAGFRGRELAGAWGDVQGWNLEEHEAGWFSHLFYGTKKTMR